MKDFHVILYRRAQNVAHDPACPEGLEVFFGVKNRAVIGGPYGMAGHAGYLVGKPFAGFQIFEPQGVNAPALGILAEGQ